MTITFQYPEWLPRATPPVPPPVDDHRIEALVNRFIAGKQEALFGASDAFYRLEGADAVEGEPAVAHRLKSLRAATLEQARDDGERAALTPRLDLHIEDAIDGVGRHVAAQRQVHQRQIIAERQTLIQRAAELEHDNDDKIAGLADANASAALERARIDGIAPDTLEATAAITAARSQILRTAIAERIANGKPAAALALFERVKDKLGAGDRRALDVPIQVASNDDAVDAWLQRETSKAGRPLTDRAAADPTLSPDQKATAAAKIAARESADESKRAATVQGLDDRLAASHRSLATNPTSYKAGTFAAVADAYGSAGEPAKAAEARRLAVQEPVLRAFAQSSPDRQERLINALPAQDRPAAEAIQRYQAEAFAKNPFTAGTTLYPDVGPPVPINDLEGRVEQARKIAARRGIEAIAPFTADEISAMRRTRTEGSSVDAEALLSRVAALPSDIRQATLALLEPQGQPASSASGAAPAVEPLPGSPEFQAADAQARELAKPSYDDLSAWQKLKVEGERLLLERESRGASFNAESAARRLQQATELRNDKDIGVVGKRYLLKNRNVVSEFTSAVGRLADAQQKLDELPSSDAVRKLFAARSATEVAQILDESGGKIASAIGIGSVPALTIGIVTSAILGPVGGGLVLTGSAGLDGYAKGLIGALIQEGVDVTDPNALVAALQDDDLMNDVRGEATTHAAIEAGIAGLASMIGVPRTSRGAAARPTKAEQVRINWAAGRKYEKEVALELEKQGKEFAEQVTIELPSGNRLRVDFLVRDPDTGELMFIEAKASQAAADKMKKTQIQLQDELMKSGGIVKGRDRANLFPGGTKLPPLPRQMKIKPQEAGQ